MAKRDFYEILGVSRGLHGSRTQVRLPQSGDGLPSRSQSRQTTTPKSNSRKLNEAYQTPLRCAEARQPMTAYGHAAFEQAAGFGARRRLRGLDVGYFRRSLRRRDEPARRRPATVPRARLGPALQYGDHARRGVCRQGRLAHSADLRRLRAVLRHRRAGGRQAEALPDLRRPGARAGAAGLLRDRAHLPALPRARRHHRRSLPRPAAAAGM